MAAGDERVRAHLWISGRVQGVGFRAYTVDEAIARGLDGWVRNTPDGRVEAVFEGRPADVEAMIAWCRRGPRAAKVSSIEVAWEVPKGEVGFQIRYGAP
jgi:acylphosphatase